MLERLEYYLTFPIMRLFIVGDPIYIYWMAGGFLFGAFWFAALRPNRPVRRVRAYLRAVMRPAIFKTPSSRVDMKLFLMTSFLFASGITTMMVSGDAIQWNLSHGLTHWLGAFPAPDHQPVLVKVAVTIGDVLCLDLGYWFAHWLMHRYPVLWEFHKVHHSAEELTPLTEWRQHPVELFLFPICLSMSVGIFYGLVVYLLGPDAQPFSFWGLNILVVALMASTLHLRHTQFWLATTGWLGRIIQSPAHHQLHHSDDERHMGKNLGLFLSVWDWAFGTLLIPRERENLQFGIGAEGEEHRTAFGAYWQPVVRAWRMIAPAPNARPADGPPAA